MDRFAAARQRLVVALDVDDADSALRLARLVATHAGWVKVASRLYARCGSDLVESLVDAGVAVFLDLKFHDIPDQVHGACRAARDMGVGLLTVHASGGAAMLQAAVEGAGNDRVLAVTVLTSLDTTDLVAVGVARPLEAQVLALAALAEQAGCRGVVSSPQELRALRTRVSTGFGLMTPGIRGPGDAAHDQKRTMAADAAIRAGATWIVVGRPIRDAADPGAAAAAIRTAIEGALPAP
jgi:orotidine-5'-phosphate decarboxylase